MRNEALYLKMVDKYMNGSCMYLAAALHHAYGLSLGMSTYYPAKNVYHVWVNLPNGKCLDIQGEQTFDEITQEIRANYPPGDRQLYMEVSLEKMTKICGRGPLTPDTFEVKSALGVAQTFLGDYLPKG